MKPLALLASLLLSTGALAEQTSLAVPNEGWAVQFDSPPLRQIPNDRAFAGYAYFGNAGRLNISLFVEPPSCPGGDANDARYACFLEKSKKSPIMLPSTIRRVDAPNGLQVTYMVKVEANGRSISALNMHLLFMRSGKEVDLHASIVQPEDDDAKTLLSLINSAIVVVN